MNLVTQKIQLVKAMKQNKITRIYFAKAETGEKVLVKVKKIRWC
jgi:ribosomal protein L39E